METLTLECTTKETIICNQAVLNKAIQWFLDSDDISNDYENECIIEYLENGKEHYLGEFETLDQIISQDPDCKPYLIEYIDRFNQTLTAINQFLCKNEKCQEEYRDQSYFDEYLYLAKENFPHNCEYRAGKTMRELISDYIADNDLSASEVDSVWGSEKQLLETFLNGIREKIENGDVESDIDDTYSCVPSNWLEIDSLSEEEAEDQVNISWMLEQLELDFSPSIDTIERCLEIASNSYCLKGFENLTKQKYPCFYQYTPVGIRCIWGIPNDNLYDNILAPALDKLLGNVRQKSKVPGNCLIPLNQVQEAIESEEGIGFCLACGKQKDDFCEPDAEFLRCEYCNEDQVFGAEQILLMDRIDHEK